MSFGTESSTPVGGQTLTGFIVSKAMQSRKDAKKSDRKERKKKEKTTEGSGREKNKGIGAKLLGGLASLPNLFKGNKPSTSESSTRKPRSSGGATGLAQILSSGFGSLTADNIQLSSSLASITQLLNNSYKAQSFTATGVQTISAILSDQLENQSSILSTVKSLKPGGGGSGGGRGGFGTAGSSKVGGGTLTEALINAAIEKGVGRFITSRLSRLNPFNRNKPPGGATPPRKPPTGGSNNPKGSYYDDAVRQSRENARRINSQRGLPGQIDNIRQSISNRASGAMNWGKGKIQGAADFGRGLLNRGSQAVDATKGFVGRGVEAGKGFLGRARGFGDNLINNPITRRIALAGTKFGARAIPVAGTAASGLEVKQRLEKGDAVGAWLAGLGGTSGAVATGAALASPGPQAAATLPAAAIAETTSLVADIGLLGYDIFRAFKPMASGGVMVGEAAGGSKGEAVVPLSSGIGKQMLGGGNSSGDPGMQTSAGSTLAVVDQFIKGMGPLGAPVAQALGPDIQQLSKTFGMSQTLPNLRIGGGKFKEDGNAKKTRDDFLEKLISGSLEALDAKKKGSQPPPKGTTQSNPGDTGTAQQQMEQQQRAAAMVSSINNMQIPGKPQGTMGTTGVSLPGGGVAPATPDKLKQVENGNNKFWYDKDGQIYHWQQAKDKSGKPIPSELRRLNSGEMGEGVDAAGNLVVNQKDFKGKSRYFIRDPKTGRVKLYQPSWMETSGVGDFLQSVVGKGKDEFDNNIPQGYYSYKWDDVYLGTETKEGKKVSKWKRASGAGDIPPFGGTSQEFRRGGAIATYPMRVPVPISPQTAIQSSPSSNPIGATNQSDPQMNSVSIINVIGGGNSGGGSIPMRKSSSQDSSQYVSDPYPKGLAGVLCMSPWSVV